MNELKRAVLNKPKHKIGDGVTWQTRAYNPPHTGAVVAILEPGDEASSIVRQSEERVGRKYSSGCDRTGGGFVHWRYLVAVPRESKKGSVLPPLYYSPLVSVVDRGT